MSCFDTAMRDVDEGPSEQDIERFDRETAYCPDCGAEIWDQAEICPKCHAYLYDGPQTSPPVEAWFRRRWMLLIVILALIGFVLVYVI